MFLPRKCCSFVPKLHSRAKDILKPEVWERSSIPGQLIRPTMFVLGPSSLEFELGKAESAALV